MTCRKSITRWHRPSAGAAALTLLWPLALAAGESATGLDTVIVSATRLRSVAAFDTPASISSVSLDAQNSRGDVNMAEVLGALPGVVALDRQNYAQDMQLSIRGFGARSTFGVRSLRLYADGIPAAMPDGQGQLSHFNLMGGDRVEVLRGPFSALYGNSSGGVVQLWSKPGSSDDSWRVKATGGSWGERTLAAQVAGQAAGLVGYNLALSRFTTDGWRDHASATRNSANGLFTVPLPGDGKLNLVGNYLNLPEAQDPLGVTRAQWDADPRQTTSVATQYDTRKSVKQTQAGAVWEQPLAADQTLRAMAYTGNRQVVQFLALPISSQTNPLNSGGVVDLGSRYGGGDLRWSVRGGQQRPYELTVGVNADEQRQQRQGFENFIGTQLGVRGKLRRDEDNTVRNVDEFAQLWWQFAPRWSVLAGVRHSQVKFASTDNYITASNPNDSGSIDYSDTTPVAGLTFEPLTGLRVYASAGNGFETPTFNELSYRADGAAGLALNLRPASSRNQELGIKWRDGQGTLLEAALFNAETRDELAVARNVGGRSSYQNVASARRQGAEAALETPLTQQLSLQLSWTRVDATFRSPYLICVAVGCTVPNVAVAAGSRIPGVARQQTHAALHWQQNGWNASFELAQMSGIVANDVATEVAPAYTLANLELGRQWRFSGGALRAFMRVDNLAGVRYIGSVIVNEGNGRYYEPGIDRTVLSGVQWQWQP